MAPADIDRLALWQKQKELTAFSEKERAAFADGLNHRLSRQRLSLLFSNHLERLMVSAQACPGRQPSKKT